MRRSFGLLLALAVMCAVIVTGSATAASNVVTLNGVVGPGFTITLKKSGRAVRTLPSGRYRIVIQDKSNIHNFRLRGPGFNRATSVTATRRTVWNVRLRDGRYRFVCDPHAGSMKGSFRVT